MSKLRIPVGPADHIAGPADAPVTLVEYGDYECPYCALAFPNVKRVQKRLGKELRFVFRHFPLTEAHPFAEAAAEAAEYAAAHDRFWEMHDGLYANQDQPASSSSSLWAEPSACPRAAFAMHWRPRDFPPRYRRTSSAACAAASMEPRVFSSTANDTRAAIRTRTSSARSMIGSMRSQPNRLSRLALPQDLIGWNEPTIGAK